MSEVDAEEDEAWAAGGVPKWDDSSLVEWDESWY